MCYDTTGCKNMSDVMDEVMDILNEDGSKTGKWATKSEIYLKGYWYRAVHIWIINDKHELLMQKRNPFKRCASCLGGL